MNTVEQSQAEVHQLVSEAMGLCLSNEPMSFAEFERRLGKVVFSIARAFVVVFLVHRARLPRPATYQVEGCQWVVAGTLTDSLGTVFGVVRWTRPVGRKAGLKAGKCDLPIDRELGLCGCYSLGSIERLAWLSAQMSFGAARRAFARFHGWCVCSRTQQRFIDGLGAQCRPFLDAQSKPTGDGQFLVIQVDAGAAPHISSAELSARCRPRRNSHCTEIERHERRAKRRQKPRKRRASGHKSKNGKMAFVGIIYSLMRSAAGLQGPVNKRLYATFQSHEALFAWLRREVDKRGPQKPLYFLADGSEHIWRLQEHYFPEAHCCLDWYHLIEKFWDVGRSLYPGKRGACEAWIGRIKQLLRAGCIDAVFKDLRDRLLATPKTGPGNKTRRQRLQEVLKYLTDHRSRLPYAAFRKIDMDIGTGLIEAAIRNLVRQRLDCSGMKWGRSRSEYVLLLRCILLDGLWDQFVAHVEADATLKLPSKPLPAVPHDAHRKAA